MLHIRFTTISNRVHEASVDVQTATWESLHMTAAGALDLDAASVKLSVGGARLPRAGTNDTPIAQTKNGLRLLLGDAAPTDAASITAAHVAVVHAIGIRNRVAGRMSREPTTSSANLTAPSTPPPANEGGLSPTTHPVGTTPAARRTTPRASPRMAAAASPPVPPPAPDARVAVPPAEVLRGVIREVEAAPNAHRRRRVITTNPVIDSLGAQVRRHANAPGGDADDVLRELMERLHVVCPDFVDKVVREYPRDFLDAINGVVGSISMPFAASAASGVPGSAFAATIAEALGGAVSAAQGGAGGDDDDDDEGAIEITGDAVSANALMGILSQAILAEIANQTGIDIPLRGPDDARTGDGDSSANDDDDDEDDNDNDEDSPEEASTTRDQPNGSGKPKRSAAVKRAETDIARMRRELDTAATLAAAGRQSAAAAQYHSIWCVLRRRWNSLRNENAGSNAVSPAEIAALRRDIGALMGKAIVSAIRALSLSSRQRLMTLLDGTLLSGGGSGSPAGVDLLPANSPNSAYPTPQMLAGTTSDGSAAHDHGFAETQHTNAVLATLDDAIIAESVATAAVITFVGDDAVLPDAARALAVTLWQRDTRRIHDVTFGLLEIDRPASGASRAVHGGFEAGGPFGTGTHTPKAFVDTAREYLDGFSGNRRAAAAQIDAELSKRKTTTATSSTTPESGFEPRTPTAPAGSFRRPPPPPPTTATTAPDDVELAAYDAEVSRLTRLCHAESLTAVVYASEQCFFAENNEGTEMSPFLTLQELHRARRDAPADARSVAFVVKPGGVVCAELLTGVVSTVQRALPRVAGTGNDIACEDALSDLGRVLLRPLARHLPPSAAASPPNAAADGAATANDSSAPHVTFITMFSADALSKGSAGGDGDGNTGGATNTAHGATSPNTNSRGGAASGSDSSGGRPALLVPFPALPLPSSSESPTVASPPDRAAAATRRVIDAYAVSVTPTIAGLLGAWAASEASTVRARIRGGPARAHRQPWLTAAAARVLNVRRQRERGAEETTRWTVLADTSAPRAASGITCDLFLATTASSGDAARGAFLSGAESGAVSSAVVSAWAPRSPAAANASSPQKATPPDAGSAAGENGGSDSAESSTDDDRHGPDHHHGGSEVAHAFRIAVVRHLLDELCNATDGVTVAAVFRDAVLAARRRYPDAGVSQWAPLVLLHSGRRLDTLRFHVRSLRAEADDRAAAMRTRLTVRGPLSAAEARNVRYVQHHDIPGVFDALCRELLASRPEGEAAVLDTLIATLEALPTSAPSPSSASQQQQQEQQPTDESPKRA